MQGRVPIAPGEDFPGTITKVHGSSDVNEYDTQYNVLEEGRGGGGYTAVSACLVSYPV